MTLNFFLKKSYPFESFFDVMTWRQGLAKTQLFLFMRYFEIYTKNVGNDLKILCFLSCSVLTNLCFDFILCATKCSPISAFLMRKRLKHTNYKTHLKKLKYWFKTHNLRFFKFFNKKSLNHTEYCVLIPLKKSIKNCWSIY